MLMRAETDMADRTCTVPRCLRPTFGQGLCRAHWGRQRHHGDVQADRPIRAVRSRNEPPRACSVPICDRSGPLTLGLCKTHYARVRATGDPQADIPIRPTKPPAKRIRPLTKQACIVDGCQSPHVARGYCNSHYDIWRAHGDPLARKFERNATPPPTCTVDGCHAPHHAKGYCKPHHLQARHIAERPEKNARMREHAKANREVYRAAKARRRIRERAAMDSVDRALSADYRRAIAKDPCRYCGGRAAADDHFFPIAKGGTDHWWNLVRACAGCNLSKRARCGTWFMLRPALRESHRVA